MTATSVRSSMFADPAPGTPPEERKRLARVAGLLYLVVGITGGFAEGYLDPSLYVPGDAGTTVGNLAANPGLVRVGVLLHLTDAVFFVLTAVTLYVLLKHVSKHAARLMVLPVVIAAPVISVSAVLTFVALRVATSDTYATAFGDVGADGLALLLLELEHYGVYAAQVFFALWLAPLGYLAYRSRLFPKSLGIILVVATVSYLADVVVAFLLPDLVGRVHVPLSVAPGIAEVWMVLYLLFVGVRSPRPRVSRATGETPFIPA